MLIFHEALTHMAARDAEYVADLAAASVRTDKAIADLTAELASERAGRNVDQGRIAERDLELVGRHSSGRQGNRQIGGAGATTGSDCGGYGDATAKKQAGTGVAMVLKELGQGALMPASYLRYV
jgi:hypothetical protein